VLGASMLKQNRLLTSLPLDRDNQQQPILFSYLFHLLPLSRMAAYALLPYRFSWIRFLLYSIEYGNLMNTIASPLSTTRTTAKLQPR
jgi:hypothetical protein